MHVLIQGTTVKGKKRDRNNINIHLQDIRDRGKIPRDVDNFEAKLTPVKKKKNYKVIESNIISIIQASSIK